jgi:hypothetical protein
MAQRNIWWFLIVFLMLGVVILVFGWFISMEYVPFLLDLLSAILLFVAFGSLILGKRRASSL